MKYYLMGALAGVIMLIVVTLLFGVGASTLYTDLAFTLSEAPRAVVAVGLVAVLAGLLFKIGAVPLHFWVLGHHPGRRVRRDDPQDRRAAGAVPAAVHRPVDL